VVMEASFGWGWLADLMKEEGLRPELSNCFKVEKMRKARGQSRQPTGRGPAVATAG